MKTTREMTPDERRRVHLAHRAMSDVRFISSESGMTLLAAGGLFSLLFVGLQRFVFSNLMPEAPVAASLMSTALAFAGGSYVYVNDYRLRKELAERMKPHLDLMAEDLREGVVEVHAHDAVESYFDRDKTPKEPDLVIKFPEGRIRVDWGCCNRNGVTEPVSGSCEVVMLPRSQQALGIKT